MSRMRRPGTSVSLVLVAVASAMHPFATSAQAGEGPALPAVVSLPLELEAVLQAYEAAWGRRSAEDLADLFTSDGFVLRPGHPPAYGRDAILAAYSDSGGPLTLRPYSYAVDGAVGYIVGGYTSDPNRPETGKFVLCVRRNPSGAWLIAADIDNGN